MKIQAPPGMRDFYPEDMRLQNWLFDCWRRVSRTFGFQEYEGPIFEFLELYTLKSGEGIVGELFNFEDRGGRRFAIRPEMTPTLARMVAARANALPRPIKWFSIPRMCRAEKPQRGRLREFFQWNADVLGVDDTLADAECIAVLVEFLRQAGLAAEDVAVRISSRPLATAVLIASGIAPEDVGRAVQLIDRFDKRERAGFEKVWDETFGGRLPAARLSELLAQPFEACAAMARTAGNAESAAADQLSALFAHLRTLGVADYCEFDLTIVRGLAYYTGMVFECRARKADLRALAGGGRYDNLTGLLDGPDVPGVGFGMGDAPILALLEEIGRLPKPEDLLDVFVIDASEEQFGKVLEIVARLRGQGLSADFSYKRSGLGKQLKQASSRGAAYALVVGSEFSERAELAVKNLRTGAQVAVTAERLLNEPRATLAGI